MNPFIIPFFIAHQGCPHRCLYCDQHKVTGRPNSGLSADEVVEGISQGLSSPRIKAGQLIEAAFYGGTFSALPSARQSELLNAAKPFIDDGRLSGLRISTRPDALSADRIEFLKAGNVTCIEIGAQSMDDSVLDAARRGHTAADTTAAALRVKAAGLRLGLQLLPGLPKEDEASLGNTVDQIIELSPDESRIYPALVFSGTDLADIYEAGEYKPWTLDQAILRCAEIFKRMKNAGIAITRIGLHNGPELDKSIIAGPLHPAFGHLVKAEVYYQAVAGAIEQSGNFAHREMELRVAPSDLSLAQGHSRSNLARIKKIAGADKITILTDRELNKGWFGYEGRLFKIAELTDS